MVFHNFKFIFRDIIVIYIQTRFKMNKLYLMLFFLFTSHLSNSQTISVDSFKVKVNKDGYATCYLSNGKQVVIKAIINPYLDNSGNEKGGSMENRQGLMLTPPIRPGVWEKDGHGKFVVVGFAHNTGFNFKSGTIFIVEGYWNDDHASIIYNGIKQTCYWGDSPDAATWVKQYAQNKYEIPNFVQTVPVTKFDDGHYTSN